MGGLSTKGSFTKKLILSMLLVGLLPLALGLSMAFYLGVQEIQEANGAHFQALAIETARNVDLVIAEEYTKNQKITKNSAIVQELELVRDRIQNLDAGLIEALLREEETAWSTADSEFKAAISVNALTEILTRNVLGTNIAFDTSTAMVARSATRALFITDVRGRVVATTTTDIPYRHRQEDWWQGAFNEGIGKPYLNNLEYNDLFETYTFAISVPVMDSIQYQPVGVLHRIYDVAEFFAPSIKPIRFGKTGHVMLIDSDGRVLSCPILATGERIADTQLISVVTPPQPGWALTSSDGHGGQDTSIIGFASLPTISRITQESTGTQWHLFVWQSSEELFAAVYHLRTWIGTFGIIAFILLLILGVLVSRRVVRPIRELQQAAKLIANRELREPITIKTGDEIEELAEELNKMNAQLQAAFSGLVSEVTTKTEEVAYLRESTVQILEGIPAPVIMVDEDLHVEYMNLAFTQAAGVVDGAQNGKNLTELLSTDTREQERLASDIHKLLSRPTSDISPNSSERTLEADQMGDPLAQHGKNPSRSNTGVITIKDRVFQSAWFTISPRPGESQKYGLVLRDATEESRLQDELINSEKFSSLGVLCSGIGHELNNPLVGVIGM
ncbi:MAG: cache domain-containing protein, partial [Nitrospirota bacterium]|nr:cache domain-containing protein [Nitrospirota bacterium]